jgi:hypothetical protein
MTLFLERLEAGRTVRGNIYRGRPAPEKLSEDFQQIFVIWKVSCVFQIIWKIPNELIKRVS